MLSTCNSAQALAVELMKKYGTVSKILLIMEIFSLISCFLSMSHLGSHFKQFTNWIATLSSNPVHNYIVSVQHFIVLVHNFISTVHNYIVREQQELLQGY